MSIQCLNWAKDEPSLKELLSAVLTGNDTVFWPTPLALTRTRGPSIIMCAGLA